MPTVRKMFGRALKLYNCECVDATDGDIAVQIIRDLMPAVLKQEYSYVSRVNSHEDRKMSGGGVRSNQGSFLMNLFSTGGRSRTVSNMSNNTHNINNHNNKIDHNNNNNTNNNNNINTVNSKNNVCDDMSGIEPDCHKNLKKASSCNSLDSFDHNINIPSGDSPDSKLTTHKKNTTNNNDNNTNTNTNASYNLTKQATLSNALKSHNMTPINIIDNNNNNTESPPMTVRQTFLHDTHGMMDIQNTRPNSPSHYKSHTNSAVNSQINSAINSAKSSVINSSKTITNTQHNISNTSINNNTNSNNTNNNNTNTNTTNNSVSIPTHNPFTSTALFDAISMDFTMNRMNGPEATRAIRELGYTGRF
jgi:CheY-like chemotaxis protein